MAELRIGAQSLESEFERFTELEREQARIAGERVAPGLTLQQHFAPGTATFRELEVWRVERDDGEPAYDVWLCSVPRGVVFVAGGTEVACELIDGSAHPPEPLVAAALAAAAAEQRLLGRWARRAELAIRAHDAAVPEQPPPGDPFDAPVSPGTLVYAKWKKRWWPAQVLSVSEDAYRIHYDGWESSWDEYVALERLCSAPEKIDVQEGDAVSVEYRGTWYDARVLAVRADGRVRVTYEGWDSSWDEDVVPARVRARVTGTD